MDRAVCLIDCIMILIRTRAGTIPERLRRCSLLPLTVEVLLTTSGGLPERDRLPSLACCLILAGYLLLVIFSIARTTRQSHSTPLLRYSSLVAGLARPTCCEHCPARPLSPPSLLRPLFPSFYAGSPALRVNRISVRASAATICRTAF